MNKMEFNFLEGTATLIDTLQPGRPTRSRKLLHLVGKSRVHIHISVYLSLKEREGQSWSASSLIHKYMLNTSGLHLARVPRLTSDKKLSQAKMQNSLFQVEISSVHFINLQPNKLAGSQEEKRGALLKPLGNQDSERSGELMAPARA